MRKFNVDQSPLPFATDTSRTYEEIDRGNAENRNKKVWSAQPTSGANKHFCSLNVCFSQKRSLIFTKMPIFTFNLTLGQTLTCVDCAERTLKPAVETNIGRAEFVLFSDNLESQIAERFRNSVKEMNRIPWYGVSKDI